MNRLTKQKFYNLLVSTSRDGLFPAIAKHPRQVSTRCRYRTEDKDGTVRRCAVGILFTDEQLEAAGVGIPTISDYLKSVYGLFDDYPALREHIPVGITVENLEIIQEIHDDLASDRGLGWDHSEFVESLNDTLAFEDINHVIPEREIRYS